MDSERIFSSVKECPVKHRSTFEVALILDGFGKGLLCVCVCVCARCESIGILL